MKILVVDNDKFILDFMKDMLSKERHEVMLAHDGLSALSILETYRPDVIFVDLVMSNIEGKKLCKIIRDRQELRDVYIIILSAIAAEERSNISKTRANECIAKGPLDEMTQKILAALERARFGTSQSATTDLTGIMGKRPRVITKELLFIKRHFEIILEQMSEGIIEISPDSKIVYANPAVLDIIDMPEEQLLGTPFAELFSEDDRQRLDEFLKTWSGKQKAITEDYPVSLNSHKITLNFLPFAENGISAIIIIDDVTEHKRAEEEKKKFEAQLQQAQKMEAIGTLGGGIAHDFNNLLMGIQGNVSLMLLKVGTSHPHYEKLKNIERYVENGADLTQQLLGFARGGKYEVQPTDLNDLVKKSADMFGRTKKEISIHPKFQGGVWTVEVDQGQIEQVLLNLYVNAWQAMPGGGKLYLQTENVMLDEEYVKLYDMERGKYVKISITDTGIGMDEATQKRIFDPFFTTKEMGRGTGLGLASAYGIIRNHGGIIHVYSEKGQGTTFNIYLPASEKEVIEDKIVPEEEVLKGTETVLLVDDEEMMTEAGGQLLEEIGYNVLIARSGKEAIEIYEKNGDEIDLVILDMVMPGMGGGETYDRLKEANHDIKVLLSTGYSIDGEASEILDRGCDGFIQKPFKIKDLSQKLREILDK